MEGRKKFEKFLKKTKKVLAFSRRMCYYIQALRGTAKNKTKYPGVAKFGIALEWGSRGLEFESRHSDQKFRFLGLMLKNRNFFLCIEKQ